jgi:hypothetical protein
VQTFLPYPDLRASCRMLDDRRLGKQRVETFQVLRALTWPEYAWKNHPAVRMWRGFVPGLVEYGLESCREWTRRGYADAVAPQLLKWTGGQPPNGAALPPWFGLEALHLSHRSALLRKDAAFYRPLFDALGQPGEPDHLPYLWPPAVFPRWPVRGGPEGVPVDTAAALLGLERPLPWQAQAVDAVLTGRDALLTARPGTGGSTTGLLAGLCRPGRTLWVSPWDGPVAGPAPHVPSMERSREPTRPPGDRPAPLARPPGPADRMAMAAEQAPPEFVFAHPDRLPVTADLADVTLLVVDRAHGLAPGEAAAVAGVRAGLDVPVLAVTGATDAPARVDLTARLRLREVVHAGGGWDPAGTRLAVRTAPTAPARRRLLAGLVRDDRPALVVTTDRGRADRLATALAADGVRAAAWAPPPMRPARASAAAGAWRSRRLDALVVPAGPLPPLGRVRAALLVGDGATLDGPHDWHALVDAVAPGRAVLLVGPDAAAGAAALAAGDGCRRAALLAPFGEPVAVPCSRCDVCDRVGATAPRAGSGPP